MNKFIHRRHKIVHEADNAKGDDTYALTFIRENMVEEWISTVRELVNLIDNEICTSGGSQPNVEDSDEFTV